MLNPDVPIRTALCLSALSRDEHPSDSEENEWTLLANVRQFGRLMFWLLTRICLACDLHSLYSVEFAVVAACPPRTAMFLVTAPRPDERPRQIAEASFRRPASESSRLRPDPTGVARVEALTKRQAEDLLDWLEARGRTNADVFVEQNGLFTVEWREL
jgi:hypothetical protein